MPFPLKFLGAVLPRCVAELNPEIFSRESVATKHHPVTSTVAHQLLKVGRGEQNKLLGTLVWMMLEVLAACSSCIPVFN